MRVLELLFVDVEAVVIPLNRTRILLQDFSGEVGHGEAERCVARHAEEAV